VLAAMLLAALSGAKGQAQSTMCKNNLAQIGQALASYTADFQEYPGTRGAPIPVPRSMPRFFTNWDQIWDHQLLPYVSGSQSIFLCPAVQPSSLKLSPSLSLTNYTYGYNAYGSAVTSSVLNLGLGRYHPPEYDPSTLLWEVSDSQVRAPSEMIAVGDLADVPSLFVTTIDPSLSATHGGNPAARHNGGANLAFCDAHIEFAKQAKWIEETDTARRRWNNDHNPHPETW
jgi:prepilin-type processing-associated H-X9-DG protein